MKLTSLPVAYTYDDLLLVPAHSNVIPDQVDVSTELCPGIILPTPILSAAMDIREKCPFYSKNPKE